MQEIKILIVEDEIIIANDISLSLSMRGFKQIGLAHSSEEAIKKIFCKKPDLVLMDINLGGGTDGIDVAEVINRNTDIPVIFMTGNTDSVTLDRLRKIKYAGLLIKPFIIENLSDLISNVIQEKIKSGKSKSTFTGKHTLFTAAVF